MRNILAKRFSIFGLELNQEKTKIIYCKDADRTGKYDQISFDFLGYTFRPRMAKHKNGKIFLNFLPAMSDKAAKAVRKEIRGWKLQLKVDKNLDDLVHMFNAKLR